jgi:hypothetical protein
MKEKIILDEERRNYGGNQTGNADIERKILSPPFQRVSNIEKYSLRCDMMRSIQSISQNVPVWFIGLLRIAGAPQKANGTTEKVR